MFLDQFKVCESGTEGNTEEVFAHANRVKAVTQEDAVEKFLASEAGQKLRNSVVEDGEAVFIDVMEIVTRQYTVYLCAGEIRVSQ